MENYPPSVLCRLRSSLYLVGKLFYDLFCLANSQVGSFRGKLGAMIRSNGLPGAHQHRSSRWLPRWQRLLLGGYSALFALVLPFICWGALAEPGHPHRTPHFVFGNSAPVKGHPPDETADELNMSAAISHQQHDNQHGGALLAVGTAAGGEIACHLSASATPVSGRATPTLLLFSILLLLFVADRTSQQPERLAFVRWLRLLSPQSYFCTVPLPPPRPARSPHFYQIFA